MSHRVIKYLCKKCGRHLVDTKSKNGFCIYCNGKKTRWEKMGPPSSDKGYSDSA